MDVTQEQLNRVIEELNAESAEQLAALIAAIDEDQ